MLFGAKWILADPQALAGPSLYPIPNQGGAGKLGSGKLGSGKLGSEAENWAVSRKLGRIASSTTTTTASLAPPLFKFGLSATATTTPSTTTANTTATQGMGFSALPKFGFPTAPTTTNTTSSSSSSLFSSLVSSSPPKFSFGVLPTSAATTTSSSSTFAFSTKTATTTTSSAGQFLPSFGFTTTSSTTPTTAPSSLFSFGGGKFPSFPSVAGGSLFGGPKATSTPANNNEGGDGNGSEDEPAPAEEEYVPTDSFKPVVPLPPKVDAKSGEENEEVLFESRCKLWRYDNEKKENKERGLGELRLLRNKDTNRYRCVMRSDDQLSKLFANFPIFAEIKAQTLTKPNIRAVQCKDFSEKVDGQDEVFLLKFRDQVTAEDFAAKLEETAKKVAKD